jgi:hypothetical protein
VNKVDPEYLDIYGLAGASILSGAPKGQLFFAKLVSSVTPTEEPSRLFLDFQGIDLMTSSFFRSAILPFRDYCVDKLNLYPVLANVSPDTLDEIDVVLKPIRDAVFLCRLDSRRRVESARVFGVLDEKQQLTLNAVLDAKEADASILKHRFRKKDDIGITGWNNRLAALVGKGLLIETQKGRVKLYRPVLELK